MVLSKREQMIAIMAMIAVGLLIGNKWVYGPIADGRGALDKERQDLKKKVDDAHRLFEKRKSKENEWQILTSNGFSNDGDAEDKVSAALNQWSSKCKLKVSSNRPERVPSDKELQEMMFAFSGTGSLTAAASFILQIETAPLPIKITSMALSSSSDTGEQMSLTLGISAIYPGTATKNIRGNQPRANIDENATL